MPIYEFFCSDCHRVYQFFSSRIDTEASPACPRCGRAELPRKPATFSTLRHRSSGDDEGDEFLPAGMDEARMEAALESVMSEMEAAGGMAEESAEDPRLMAKMMRRFGEAAGLEPGGRMEEMLARMEAGEDPDSLEDEMGDELDESDDLSDLFRLKKALGHARRSRRPETDPELYFL